MKLPERMLLPWEIIYWWLQAYLVRVEKKQRFVAVGMMDQCWTNAVDHNEQKILYRRPVDLNEEIGDGGTGRIYRIWPADDTVVDWHRWAYNLLKEIVKGEQDGKLILLAVGY